MNQDLMGCLELNSIFDHSQHGFRQHHSSESALIVATEEIRRQLDDGGKAILILLDLSAASDIVTHQVLIQRLKAIGINVVARSLLALFLMAREQRVCWDNYYP